jgi:hypothetical protein
MRYSSSKRLEEAYNLIAHLYVTEFQDAKSSPRAMTIAAALAELGEDRGWASVWWAYGAVHYDLSDEGYATALERLEKVDASGDARAAALMLRAEIEFTQAIQHDAEPDGRKQVEFLSEAVALAPEWPLLRVRLARAFHSLGRGEEARRHAEVAMLMEGTDPSDDPFDTAFTGKGLRPGWAHDELAALTYPIASGVPEVRQDAQGEPG